MTKVRWGLLSTAHINSELIPIIQNSPRGELAAVASRYIDKAKAYAHEWGIPQAFGSYEAMIGFRNDRRGLHQPAEPLTRQWSIRASQAGVHVLCEKPCAFVPGRSRCSDFSQPEISRTS
jgi:predicted dehydrogenase